VTINLQVTSGRARFRGVSAKPSHDTPRSDCPIANSLDVIGDRWTLVVIRDLMFSDKRRYNELLSSSEGITTNILAERLKRLERAGIVDKRAYQDNPPRYEYSLSAKGEDLRDVLIALVRWGGKHAPGSRVFPAKRLEAMKRRS
jgi:DNA-binding HxlR family transcriptional regulator